MSQRGWTYVRRQLGLIFLILVLALVTFVIGLMVGYAVLGEGHDPFAILSLHKWQSLIDKFTGN